MNTSMHLLKTKTKPKATPNSTPNSQRYGSRDIVKVVSHRIDDYGYFFLRCQLRDGRLVDISHELFHHQTLACSKQFLQYYEQQDVRDLDELMRAARDKIGTQKIIAEFKPNGGSNGNSNISTSSNSGIPILTPNSISKQGMLAHIPTHIPAIIPTNNPHQNIINGGLSSSLSAVPPTNMFPGFNNSFPTPPTEFSSADAAAVMTLATHFHTSYPSATSTTANTVPFDHDKLSITHSWDTSSESAILDLPPLETANGVSTFDTDQSGSVNTNLKTDESPIAAPVVATINDSDSNRITTTAIMSNILRSAHTEEREMQQLLGGVTYRTNTAMDTKARGMLQKEQIIQEKIRAMQKHRQQLAMHLKMQLVRHQNRDKMIASENERRDKHIESKRDQQKIKLKKRLSNINMTDEKKVVSGEPLVISEQKDAESEQPMSTASQRVMWTPTDFTLPLAPPLPSSTPPLHRQSQPPQQPHSRIQFSGPPITILPVSNSRILPSYHLPSPLPSIMSNPNPHFIHSQPIPVATISKESQKYAIEHALLKSGLQCSLCNQIYSVPVTIECGHSFCWKCIWDNLQSLVENKECAKCPQCQQMFGWSHNIVGILRSLKNNLSLQQLIETCIKPNLDADERQKYQTRVTNDLTIKMGQPDKHILLATAIPNEFSPKAFTVLKEIFSEHAIVDNGILVFQMNTIHQYRIRCGINSVFQAFKPVIHHYSTQGPLNFQSFLGFYKIALMSSRFDLIWNDLFAHGYRTNLERVF